MLLMLRKKWRRLPPLGIVAALACSGAFPLRATAVALDNNFDSGPGGTTVPVRLTERVSSQEAQTGQAIHFATTEPVVIDGARVPAGTPADGFVIYVRSGRGPRPGKMRLSAAALHLAGGKTIAVGLEPSEAATVSAADTAHAAGLAFPSSAGTIVVGGITRGNNVVYERGTRFTLLAPPPPTPEPEAT